MLVGFVYRVQVVVARVSTESTVETGLVDGSPSVPLPPAERER